MRHHPQSGLLRQTLAERKAAGQIDLTKLLTKAKLLHSPANTLARIIREDIVSTQALVRSGL